MPSAGLGRGIPHGTHLGLGIFGQFHVGLSYSGFHWPLRGCGGVGGGRQDRMAARWRGGQVSEPQTPQSGEEGWVTLGLCSEPATAIAAWNLEAREGLTQSPRSVELGTSVGMGGSRIERVKEGRNYTDAILKLQCQGPADGPQSPPPGTRGDAGVWRGSVSTRRRLETLVYCQVGPHCL